MAWGRKESVIDKEIAGGVAITPPANELKKTGTWLHTGSLVVC
jgi:hypothetical protein